jgi:predicted  nucleic acid-binding Zn-ribbon protein
MEGSPMDDKSFEGMTDAEKFKLLRRDLTKVQTHSMQLAQMLQEVRERLAKIERQIGLL